MYSLAIVDDEQEQREGLGSMFPWERTGFRVDGVFSSGRETLSFLRDRKVHVLLTDIRMPYMSGLELIREAKNTIPDTDKLICCILSAWQEFSFAQEAMSLGVRHYLLKPTDFDQIHEVFSDIKSELDNRVRKELQVPEVEHPLLSRAITLMMNELDNCTLQNIANSLEINPSYLSRLFKFQTGVHFHNFLLSMKMKRAAAMLLANDHYYRNIDMAQALGYGDTQNFCRAFRKYHNMTPGEFRRRHRET